MANARPLYVRLHLREDRQIRLARVKQASTEDYLECELQNVVLPEDKSLDYVAISYTWGPSSRLEIQEGVTDQPVCKIRCNGEPLMITRNLYNFLLRVKANPDLDSRWLWIDAICIDQENEIEKTGQVNLMAAIYHSAALVVIWLGEEDKHTEKSFALINALAETDDKDLKSVTPRSLDNIEGGVGRDLRTDRTYWHSLVALFRRRYFTRTWIIQEVTLPEERLAICGGYVIPWTHIVKVSKYLTITSWNRWMHANGSPAVNESYTFNHVNPNFIEANRRTRLSGDKNLMLYSLIRARRFEASEPRDKVYALLGVAGISVQNKPRYEPVYDTRSVVDAYVNAAIQILEDSDDLLLLAHAEGQVFRSYADLPSWVPDWSVARAVGLGVTGYTRFWAAKDLKVVPRHLEIDEEHRRLVSRGLRLDSVVSVAETKAELLRGQACPKLLAMLCNMPERYSPLPTRTHCTDQAPSEVLWRVLITDTGGIERTHPASPDFAAAGLTWLRSRIKAAANLFGDQSLVVDALNRLASVDKETQSSSGLDADEYEAIFSHAQHLRPFTTQNNCFGVGSESLSEGDSVWIIAGSRVPLLLRQTAEGSFRIVGGAYVHGFMAGEAFDSLDDFEEIVII